MHWLVVLWCAATGATIAAWSMSHKALKPCNVLSDLDSDEADVAFDADINGRKGCLLN